MSLTNRSSATPVDHFLIQSIQQLNIESYTSPTTSDWMRISCPAVKMGPGESKRSHRPDEFVLVDELKQGIEGYIRFIEKLAE